MVALRVGAIHIIESLRPLDRKTGAHLRDRLLGLPTVDGPALEVHFWSEPTRDRFLSRLRQIATDTRNSGRAPIVDLQTHGDLDGLEVTSGEIVTWGDLKAPLTEINLTCRLNLLVLVGACDGEALLHVLQAHERAPVWGLIGPNRPAWDQEIEAGHAAFYETLLSRRDGGIAVSAMNAAADQVPGALADSPFHFFGAEWFFSEVMQAYFREQASEAQLARRVEGLAAEAIERAEREGLSPEQLARFAAAFPLAMDAHLRNHQRIFDHYKAHFFFRDLCPEEWSRFEVALAGCLPAARAT